MSILLFLPFFHVSFFFFFFQNKKLKGFPGSTVGLGSDIVTAVTLVGAVPQARSLAQELLHASSAAKKKKKKKSWGKEKKCSLDLKHPKVPYYKQTY